MEHPLKLEHNHSNEKEDEVYAASSDLITPTNMTLGSVAHVPSNKSHGGLVNVLVMTPAPGRWHQVGCELEGHVGANVSVQKTAAREPHYILMI